MPARPLLKREKRRLFVLMPRGKGEEVGKGEVGSEK
jgi:hypothetical protein